MVFSSSTTTLLDPSADWLWLTGRSQWYNNYNYYCIGAFEVQHGLLYIRTTTRYWPVAHFFLARSQLTVLFAVSTLAPVIGQTDWLIGRRFASMTTRPAAVGSTGTIWKKCDYMICQWRCIIGLKRKTLTKERLGFCQIFGKTDLFYNGNFLLK